MSNQLYSEQYRLAAKDWVEKESAASLLEETKSAVLAQRWVAQITVNGKCRHLGMFDAAEDAKAAYKAAAEVTFGEFSHESA